MIDPNWQLVDLDPYTWRAIGRFISPGQFIRAGNPDEHGLYVLHDDGRFLNAVDNRNGTRRDLEIGRIADPSALANELFARDEWDRVHVIDRRHLALIAGTAQATPQYDTTLDAYYRQVFRLLWDGDEGYVAQPRHPGHWNHWTYQLILDWLTALPQPATLAVGVINGEDLEIGLIADFDGGLFRTITTFEALPIPRSDAAITRDYLDRLWSELEKRPSPPAVALLCTSAVFEAWIAGAEKSALLDTAIASGDAILRWPSGGFTI